MRGFKAVNGFYLQKVFGPEQGLSKRDTIKGKRPDKEHGGKNKGQPRGRMTKKVFPTGEIPNQDKPIRGAKGRK